MSGKRVLLVKDTTVNQKLIGHILRKLGIEVEIARNGRQAVESMSPDVYDLILMDMQMPIMDGFQATRILREQGYKLPIIALTANVMKDDIERCLVAGCDDHIPKPFERRKSIEKVTEIFS